ncbi:hypothetical protein [Chloroflexus aggregans]|uniref:Uncharacterized protein n=1 Tax=Chloroflexus aggregans (strain MD-66 / DSM 9485) TaxID=326427 RepID=B8GCE4_CHLAD|nr:hypothetical protein [Chloroflexus aggregans]ACL24988.1 hypothetical protein Cagg_2101 [Chloroflexus aggregans DSM 9485]
MGFPDIIKDQLKHMHVFPPIEIPDHEVEAWLRNRWRKFWQMNEADETGETDGIAETGRPTWVTGTGGTIEMVRRAGGTVAEKLVAAAERAIREGRIDRSTKIETGHIRYLVNDEPVHQDGTPFFAPRRLSNGLYIETHTSNRQADQQVELLDHYNRR